jgi:uncharacterized protein (DUF2147 family)
LSYASAVLAAFLLASNGAAPIEGDWLTDGATAVVRIGHCGPHLCGAVARVLAKGADVPHTDVHNPDPALRSRPLVGLPVLTGFTRDGDQWTGGRAYDAGSGRSYKAKLAPGGDGTLTVTGCILFLCKSQTWTRAGR